MNIDARFGKRTSPAANGEGEATIESLTQDARGVARIDGKTTFIEGALPGERVRFRYARRRSRYDTGTAIEIVVPSPDRVAAPCPHFGTCGGCTLQQLSSDAQLRSKARVLAESLRRLGRVQPTAWLAPIAGPTTGYRRRARLGVRLVPKMGGVLVGFRERRRSFIAPLADCLTLDPRLAALLPVLPNLVAGLSRPDRVPQIEMSAGDDAAAIVLRHLEPLTANDMARLRDFAAERDIGLYLQPRDSASVRPLWPEAGVALTYRLPAFAVTLSFGVTDFVQVNAAVNRDLVRRAVDLLDVAATDRVVDLFCGVGNFSLALARRAARVAGYEADTVLARRARENAAANGIVNAEFEIANLYDKSGAAPWVGGGCDKLLLDPPRAGAMAALKALPPNDLPGRIVYVSCNPATLARDSEYLVHRLGYRLEAAGVADMFPHTSHVESMVLFVRP
ncbi:MAG TPA: 23S rRNA (uracil(1939)-C(5))-methyltransferase RlmD [Burkholderiales bacterium]